VTPVRLSFAWVIRKLALAFGGFFVTPVLNHRVAHRRQAHAGPKGRHGNVGSFGCPRARAILRCQGSTRPAKLADATTACHARFRSMVDIIGASA
jgi:hypothetical protein